MARDNPTAISLRTGSTGSPERLAVDDDAAELAESLGLEREKSAVKDQKRDERESEEDEALKVESLPEDRRKSERLEPQGFHVVPDRRSAAEHDGRQDRENEQADPPGRSTWRRPVDYHIGTPVAVAVHSVSF